MFQSGIKRQTSHTSALFTGTAIVITHVPWASQSELK
jgi:hypothetical protein